MNRFILNAALTCVLDAAAAARADAGKKAKRSKRTRDELGSTIDAFAVKAKKTARGALRGRSGRGRSRTS